MALHFQRRWVGLGVAWCSATRVPRRIHSRCSHKRLLQAMLAQVPQPFWYKLYSSSWVGGHSRPLAWGTMLHVTPPQRRPPPRPLHRRRCSLRRVFMRRRRLQPRASRAPSRKLLRRASTVCCYSQLALTFSDRVNCRATLHPHHLHAVLIQLWPESWAGRKESCLPHATWAYRGSSACWVCLKYPGVCGLVGRITRPSVCIFRAASPCLCTP